MLLSMEGMGSARPGKFTQKDVIQSLPNSHPNYNGVFFAAQLAGDLCSAF